MPKLTLEQKRLETLRRQLSGHPPESRVQSPESRKPNTFSFIPTEAVIANPHSSGANLSTTAYLKNDLLKILLLSGLAILIQVSIFYASRSHLLRINF